MTIAWSGNISQWRIALKEPTIPCQFKDRLLQASLTNWTCSEDWFQQVAIGAADVLPPALAAARSGS